MCSLNNILNITILESQGTKYRIHDVDAGGANPPQDRDHDTVHDTLYHSINALCVLHNVHDAGMLASLYTGTSAGSSGHHHVANMMMINDPKCPKQGVPGLRPNSPDSELQFPECESCRNGMGLVLLLHLPTFKSYDALCVDRALTPIRPGDILPICLLSKAGIRNVRLAIEAFIRIGRPVLVPKLIHLLEDQPRITNSIQPLPLVSFEVLVELVNAVTPNQLAEALRHQGIALHDEPVLADLRKKVISCMERGKYVQIVPMTGLPRRKCWILDYIEEILNWTLESRASFFMGLNVWSSTLIMINTQVNPKELSASALHVDRANARTLALATQTAGVSTVRFGAQYECV